MHDSHSLLHTAAAFCRRRLCRWCLSTVVHRHLLLPKTDPSIPPKPTLFSITPSRDPRPVLKSSIYTPLQLTRPSTYSSEPILSADSLSSVENIPHISTLPVTFTCMEFTESNGRTGSLCGALRSLSCDSWSYVLH
ncbi:hypothetical protein BDY19DRAFT_610366 [Irpex rosettiformis]|uniref:Uncharacterized protein n=1 Tax=Irpex rosettiformis TaxID=378272 RepID=A0ACB8TPE9_9APHY|nr:hypothetical protein BDY19DRAFT_610366 [Irpex rosettiformis]